MPKLVDVCEAIRSKNAGPFWITVDLFFKGREEFERYAGHEALGTQALARIYDVDPSMVKHFPVERLHMLKVSYPRPLPQGGITERDMHGGQQFVRLLDIEL